MRSAFDALRARPLAVLALAVAASMTVAACNLSDPTSPNLPSDLTGNNPNSEAGFTGTISLSGGGVTAPADGTTDVLVNIRVRDANGNPVGNGIQVNLATDLGTIRAFGSDPASAGTSVRLATFEGKASVLLNSTSPGQATVTAWIADVASTLQFEFDRVPLVAALDTAFRTLGGDRKTVLGAAPASFEVVGKAKTPEGDPIAGVNVRFRIIRDTTAQKGRPAAVFAAPVLTSTDTIGEATNTLQVFGVGDVTVNARLLDPVDGAVIFQSNQIIATTTEISATTAILLQFDDGSTTTTALIDTVVGMTATVTDTLTGEPLRGVLVRFEIREDSAEDDPAALATPAGTFTNTNGEAVNAIVGNEADSTVVLEVQVVDQSDGEILARSNQIIIRFTEPEEEE